ncbi:MAG: TniQ family protein [Proteobacteria bacterium]|nr:TniQ family protein [Pseudomonadota bacterium]
MHGLARLPAPYEDELIGSVFVRASQWSGLELSRVFRNLIGVPRAWLPYAFSDRLGELSDSIGLAADVVLRNHTLFPYQASYEDPAQICDLEQRLLIRSSGVNNSRGLLSRLGRGLPFTLRFCPLCIGEDIDKRGEPYWHRSHNLPLVQTCFKHRLALWQSPKCTHCWHQFQQGLPDSARGTQILVATTMEVAHALTAFSVKALHSQSHPETAKREEALRSMGYSVRNSAYAGAQLSEDLRYFYGNDFLESVGSGIPDARCGWPRSLVSSRKQRRTATSRHVLFDVFLSEAPATTKERWSFSNVHSKTPADLDAILAQGFRSEVAEIAELGLTATRDEVLTVVGALSRFRHGPARYPLLAAAVAEFRGSSIGNRNGSRTAVRQKPYWNDRLLDRATPQKLTKRHALGDDEAYAALLRTAINELKATNSRATVRTLLESIGIKRLHRPERYPLALEILMNFRHSSSSIRRSRCE